MRDGTYADPIWQSGVIPLGVLGLAIFILAACFMANTERRRIRKEQADLARDQQARDDKAVRTWVDHPDVVSDEALAAWEADLTHEREAKP